MSKNKWSNTNKVLVEFGLRPIYCQVDLTRVDGWANLSLMEVEYQGQKINKVGVGKIIKSELFDDYTIFNIKRLQRGSRKTNITRWVRNAGEVEDLSVSEYKRLLASDEQEEERVSRQLLTWWAQEHLTNRFGPKKSTEEFAKYAKELNLDYNNPGKYLRGTTRKNYEEQLICELAGI